MRRCVAVMITSAVVLAGLAAPAAATPGGGKPPTEYAGVRSVLPPGQSGSIDAVEAAQVTAGDPEGRRAVDGENAPPDFADQLEMYDAPTRGKGWARRGTASSGTATWSMTSTAAGDIWTHRGARRALGWETGSGSGQVGTPPGSGVVR